MSEVCWLTAGYFWHVEPISSAPAASVALLGELLLANLGKFSVCKTDTEVEKDMAPLDIHFSTCKQNLKCVLVMLLSKFHDGIVHTFIKHLVISMKHKSSS